MKLFVAGTDTAVGKTYISVGLLNSFRRLGLSTLGIKPVSSGCVMRDNTFYNDDALALQEASSIKLPYHCINPFAFEPPIAPHIAAKQKNIELNLQRLKEGCRYAMTVGSDVCLIEGVGGWLTPLNNSETMADFVVENELKVILVIGVKLGCLNHSLLTYEAMARQKVNVIGWIGNCVDPKMEFRDENILALQEWLLVPCLGVVDYKGCAGHVAPTFKTTLNNMHLEPTLS